MKFDTENDPITSWAKVVMSRRSCLVGQSGIGKSSLAMQMAVSWALGKRRLASLAKPWQSLLIQAENDFGDVSEMLRGMFLGGNKNATGGNLALQGRFAIVAESVQTGEEFANAVRLLVAKHKPDLVARSAAFVHWGRHFKGTLLVLFAQSAEPHRARDGKRWMIMHTPKPSTDPNQSGWNATDHSYVGQVRPS